MGTNYTNDLGIDFPLLGSRIADRRKKAGMTQAILAEKMDVTVGYISQIERGNAKINLSSLAKISNILNCNIADFLSDTNVTSENYLNNDFSKIYDKLDPNEKYLLYKILTTYLKER